MQKYTESHKVETDDIIDEIESNDNNDFNKSEINLNNTNGIFNNNQIIPNIPNIYMNNSMQINIRPNNQNLMNGIYMNQFNKINTNNIIPQKNSNMNINMNVNNNINNGSILYYNQAMNLFNGFNQNLFKK